MASDIPLDYAVLQLSPRRSRCELFVSYDGTIEKLASGLVKPFLTHLRVAEEQVGQAAKSIKLEVERHKKSETWFTKGTLERFVRFVSTPEVLEMVHTFDSEMCQLEAARRIYSQGTRDDESGRDGSGGVTTSDATKKELLRAIDVRLVAVRQDLTTACTRASAAGFDPDSVPELQLFADQFGAQRLSEACTKFSLLFRRRPDLLTSWKPNIEDRALRSSSGSDMSIDDPPDDLKTGFHHAQQWQPDKSNSTLQRETTNEQPPVTFALDHSSVCPNNLKESDNMDKDVDKNNKVVEAVPESSSIQSSQPTRRLSVQDRINMFESKQKENSSSAGSGGKPVVGKSVELRRLSSDVSSGFEKAVLRRWSGASDMSIDLSGERREPNSNAGTPTSCIVSQIKPLPGSLLSPTVVISPVEKEQTGSTDADGPSLLSGIQDATMGAAAGGGSDSRMKDQKNSKDVDDSKKEEVDANTSGRNFGMIRVAVSGPEDFSTESNLASVSGRSENVGRKDQHLRRIYRSTASIGGAKDFGLEHQTTGQTQCKPLIGKPKLFGSTNQATEEGVKALVDVEQMLVVKQAVPGSQLNEIEGDLARKDDRVAHEGHSGLSAKRIGAGQSDAEDSQALAAEVRNIAALNQQDNSSWLRASQRALVDAMGSDSKDRSDNKDAEPDPVAQPKLKSFAGVDREERVDQEPLEKQLDPSPAEVGNYSIQRTKFQKHSSLSDYGKKARRRRDNVGPGVGNSLADIVDRSTSRGEGAFSSPTPTPPVKQVQRVRQSKGLDDDLKMKANELEKLFAEHKLRAPGDQSNLSLIGKSVDMQTKQETEPEIPQTQFTAAKMVDEPSRSSSSLNNFDSTPPTKALDNQYYDATPKQNIFSLSFPDDSRGKFYDRYMQKRDAKLREEWSLRRSEKEAHMKSMHDNLEQSRAELNSKLAAFSDGRDAASHARRRAEKLRSFNARAMRRQQPLEAYMSDEDEDQADFSGLKVHRQDGISSDIPYRSAHSKKLAPNRNTVSSAPRALGSAASHLSMKASNTSVGKRKLQSENPVSQSVHNFSDLRKENTKPSSGSSKTTTVLQVRSYGRTRSGGEDNPRQFPSLRKNSANHVELNDFDAVDLTPLKCDNEETEITHDFSSNPGLKPFTRKQNSVGNVSVSGISKSKSFLIEETRSNGDGESMDMAKEEEGHDLIMVGEDSPNADKDEPRLSQGSYKSANSGSGNSDAIRCVSQADSGSIAELPLVMEPTFRAMGPAQGSPGESPGSWNARSHNPYSFSNEISDIDASVDSPIGSPAYWNPQSIPHTETEAARMRKKWGAAQKPIVVTDSFHGQSLKDVTKGFKRFLKFGRKNRGTENGADWISATTSEGDDDTEDGRDAANRSSEDLRKSRMGFSQGNSSDYGFNEIDFNEQVQAFQSSIPAPPTNFKLRDEHLSGSSLKAPRSFFSLSSFRSKGSDPKPR
ncbi:hypothetical protein Dimus_003922 [Dionaea muscipula]